MVLDVQPAAEHAAGHLPGAVSIPIGELRRRLAELPADRGDRRLLPRPLPAFAHQGILHAAPGGVLQPQRLEDGLPEWQAAGLAVTGA